jgi:hypothetical protein
MKFAIMKKLIESKIGLFSPPPTTSPILKEGTTSLPLRSGGRFRGGIVGKTRKYP